MRSPLAKLAAAGLLLGACSYDYTNPAEKLDAGQVTGRLVADATGSGNVVPLGGVTVLVKGSASASENQASGRFYLFGLPQGRHTLLFIKAIPGAGTKWALQRDVDLGFGSDGQLEGVLLGDLRLRGSVELGGIFSVPFTSACGDFTDPTLGDSLVAHGTPPTGLAVDEVTGQVAEVLPETEVRYCYNPLKAIWEDTLEYTGGFTWKLPVAPVGPHRLRFAVTANGGFYAGQTWVGGPLVQNVPVESEGQVLALAPTALRDPDVANPGRIRFRLVLAQGSPAPYVALNNYSTGGLVEPTPDSSGWIDETLDEGIWEISVDVGGDPAWVVPVPANAIVVANQVTEFGEVAVLDLFDVEASQLACGSQSDCYSTETCTGGVCVPIVPMPDTPYCVSGELVSSQCTDTCAYESCGYDGSGSCSDWGGSVILCIPASSSSGNCRVRETGEILYSRSGC